MHDQHVVTRRFERDEPDGRRFWEIELDGAHFNARRGRVEGGLVDGKRRSFDSPQQATDEAETLIFERLRQGWHEVGSPAHNPRLEAAIVDDVDDDAGWSVYADWLQSRGDRLGEWLGRSLAAVLPDAELASSPLWSPELAWLADRLDISQFARLEHRHGFVVRAWIGKPERDLFGQEPKQLLAALLHGAIGRLLHGLTIGLIEDFAQIDAMLGEHEAIVFAQLRELCIRHVHYRGRWIPFVRCGDLSRVLRACPSLETLDVRGSAISCGSAIQHPRLTRLTIESVDESSELLRALSSASLPSLIRLVLSFEGREIPETAIEDMQALVHDERSMAGLREFTWIRCKYSDSLAEALVRSNRLARLEHVDLSRGTLSESGGGLILDHAARFRHLRSIDLRANYLPAELAAALAEALPRIVRVDQQEDLRDRAIGRRGALYFAPLDD